MSKPGKKYPLIIFQFKAPWLAITLAANSADNESSNGAGIKKTDTFIKSVFSGT